MYIVKVILLLGYLFPLFNIGKILKTNVQFLRKKATFTFFKLEINIKIYRFYIITFIVYIYSVLQLINIKSYIVSSGILMIVLYLTLFIYKKDIVKNVTDTSLIKMLLALIITSIDEELHYRIIPYAILAAFLYFTGFNHILLKILYLVITSILFGYIHKNVSKAHVIHMIVFGLGLGVLILYAGILSTISLHLIYNFAALPIEYSRNMGY